MHPLVSAIIAGSGGEVRVSYTVTAGTTGSDPAFFGFRGFSTTFGSISASTFRGNTIDAVYGSDGSVLDSFVFILNGSHPQDRFRRLVLSSATLNSEDATTFADDGTRTTWTWVGDAYWIATGSQSLIIAY